MAFVKERIPEADKDLFDSFEAYDYDNGRIHTWKLAGGPSSKWVVDRQNEVYFFYVYGGHHLEQHPYMQYDLVWKGKKAVIFIEMSVCRNPTTDDPMRLHAMYNIVSIRASKEFKKCAEELISLIIELIKADHSVSITDSGTFANKNTMEITRIRIPEYFDEVR